MAAALASSMHIPANLQTAPIPVRGGFGPISSRLVSRSIRPLTTLLPSLFLRSGVCGEIVNQLARTCTFSLLIVQKICSLTILISFSPFPMLGRMELCVPSNLPFSSSLYWEMLNLAACRVVISTLFLGKLSQSKQITSTKCTSPRGLAELLSGPNAGTGYFIL